MIYLLLVLYSAIFTWRAIINFKSRQLFELFPSIVWLSVIVFPFVYQFNYFDPTTVGLHSLGVFLTGFTLLFCDSLNMGNIGWPPKSSGATSFLNRHGKWLGIVIFLTIVTLQVSHILLMPKVPLFEKYFGATTNESDLEVMRENSSNFLRVPRVLLYLFQYTMLIFAPLGFWFLMKARRYNLSLILFLCCFFYSRITLAKGLLYVFLILCFILIWSELSQGWRKKLSIGFGLAVALPLLYSLNFLLFHPNSIVNYVPKPKVINSYQGKVNELYGTSKHPALGLTDHLRLMNQDASVALAKPNRFEQYINYYVYRIFLVPVDVSDRWYAYFPAVYGDFFGYSLLKEKDFRFGIPPHPANLVGVWAFTKRFPSEYSDSNRSYASIDADAYARKGILGLVVVLVLLALVRILLKYTRLLSPASGILNTTGLFVIGINLPMASLQATLIAQGVLMVLFLQGSLIFLDSEKFTQICKNFAKPS